MNEVIFVGKRFTLGICRCGCQQTIKLKMTNCKLQKFVKGHHAFGENNSDWKGGRRVHVEGYIEIYSPNHPKRDARNIVREHRLVWEQEHDAMLLPWAHVHHKDHDIKNNVWYNLQAMTNSQHQKLHHSSSK